MTGEEKIAYRRTKQWKEYRKVKLEECNHTCSMCGIQKKGLNVHHYDDNTYGKETLKDTVVLCSSCHKHIIERFKRRVKNKVDIDVFCERLKEIYRKSSKKKEQG